MSSKKSLYRCPSHPKCTYTSCRKNNLRRHTLTMHSPIPTPVVCCGISWTTTWEARSHRLQAHNGSFKCDQCSRMFDRRGLLQRHMSVHTGAKAFSCPRCDYQSSHKSNMQRHASSRHKLKLFDGIQRRRPRRKRKRADSSSSTDTYCDSPNKDDVFRESDDSETETSARQSRSVADEDFKTETVYRQSRSMADDDSDAKVPTLRSIGRSHNDYDNDDETESSAWQSRGMADNDSEVFTRQSGYGNDPAWIFDGCESESESGVKRSPRLHPVREVKAELEADVENSSVSQRHLLERASPVDADDKREVAHILVAFQYYDLLSHSNKDVSVLMG